MKTIITSKKRFYKDLHSLCEEIGKKYLNGEKVDLDKEVWHVLNNGKQNKITFEISCSEPDPEHTNIILKVFSDEWHLKRMYIVIELYHCQKAYEDLDTSTVTYSIGNMFYSTMYLNEKCKSKISGKSF